MQSIFVFLDITKVAYLRRKNDYVSRPLGVCTQDLYIFWIFFRWCIAAKFHHCRICVRNFREEGHFCHISPPIREHPQKRPSQIGLKNMQENEQNTVRICISYRTVPIWPILSMFLIFYWLICNKCKIWETRKMLAILCEINMR